MSWELKKLSDIANEFRETYEPTIKEHLPYVGLEHIEQQTLRLSGIGDSASTRSTKRKFAKGDILFGSLRPYFRKVVQPKFDGVCSTDITVIRKKGDNSQDFLRYLISNESFINYSTNYSNGTRMPRANWNVIKNSEWKIPKSETQRKIASILSAYDDLIENNTRRIKILEEMAQAIYREWFVSFRFPGHEKVKFVDSELGKIPEGWEVAEVKALVNRYKAGKKFTQKNVKSEGDVIVIDQSTDELLGYHNEEPDHIATPNKPRIIFGDHTCKMQLMVRPFSVGPNVIPFDSKNEVPVQFLFYLINSLVKTREYKRHWNELISKSVVLPIKELQLEFSKKIIPFFEAIEQYKNKNSNLRKTRDLLLPKLMSGEIDVEEMDIPINND